MEVSFGGAQSLRQPGLSAGKARADVSDGPN
jgi:hypothetical protein